MSLTLSSRLNLSTAPATAATERYVLASIVAQDQDKDKKRHPIDLAIVLDKSGSMNQSKLELCIKTLEFLIEHALTEEDFLALVTFDSDVDVVYAGGKMNKDNKQSLLTKIRNIRAGSCTNLSGGLFAGLELLKKNGASDISALCVLTDGIMNEGITDRRALVQATQKIISEFPRGKAKPSVFTFGYGTDADSDSMKQLSEGTGGTYYSIVNPESVPVSFADCLGGLMAVAAQTVQLSCEISGGGAEIAGEPLTIFPSTRISATAYQVNIKDMYCGEHRDILFKLKFPPLSAIDLPPTDLILTLKYMDTVHEIPQSTVSTIQVARYPGSVAPFDEVPDVEVTRHLMRIEAAKAMDEARAAAERGDYANGRSRMDDLIGETAQTMANLGLSEESDLMLNEVLSDLKQTRTNLANANMYNQFGRSQMQSAAMSHAWQRSNKVDSMLESDEAVDRSAYAQGTKKQMIRSAKAAFGF